MALIGAFITITRPYERADTFDECLESAKGFCDEVKIIDGEETWPQEFEWPIIGEHFQRGYEALNTRWVLHLDTDFIFHENDYDNIRETLERSDAPALSFYKFQFVLPDRYNLKSRLVIAVNKGKYGDRIRFDSGGDLAQPSLDGLYLSPDDVPESKIGFWNYEKICKTKEQIKDDVGRMERAYKRHFGKTQYGSDGTDEDAYEKWYNAQRGKLNKPHELVKLEDHPASMINTIKNLTPEQFGFSGFGMTEECVYG